jgi:O-antigen ligase
MPSRLRHLVDRDALGALVLALAIPLLFVHERFQPTYVLELGSTAIDIRLSDGAIVVVVVAALVAAIRFGLSRLQAARMLWIPGISLVLWLGFATFRPTSLDDGRFDDHLVSFVKLFEYALVAVAIPLLVRRRSDLAIVLAGVVLWAGVASAVALVQLFGLDVFEASTAGWRYPSFLGRHDLAALSALATSLAAAGIVVGRRAAPVPRLSSTATLAGVIGLVLAGSVTAAAGLAVGVGTLALASHRRFAPSARHLLALAAIVGVVAVGVTAVRSAALNDFLQFVGIRDDDQTQGVESYSQRTVLAYIGLRIWQDSPIVGVGWQRSSRPEVFEPYIPDARERFPDVVDLAFPAEGREWGVQNLYIQMLADAGLIGLLLLLAVGAAGLVLAWRTVTYAPNPWAAGAGLTVLCALLTLAGEWASLGIVAGIPLQAATCLLLGLAAAGAATVEEETGG